MVFGLISSLDNETTKYIFRGKRITEEHYIPNYEIGRTVSNLKSGDTVYAISVNRFDSISHLMAIGQLCMQKGVALRFIGQPSLDIANGKYWRDAVLWQMQEMRKSEMMTIGILHQRMQMNAEGWEIVRRCIERMSMEILAHTFSPVGILKRGN